jgi:hypothetical protein
MLKNIPLVETISSVELVPEAISSGLEFNPEYGVVQMPLSYRFGVPSMAIAGRIPVFFADMYEETMVINTIVQTPSMVDWHNVINYMDFLKMQPAFRTNLVKLPMNVDVSDINFYKG